MPDSLLRDCPPFSYPETRVPHRILNNLSWLEHIVHQEGDEYTFELGDSLLTCAAFKDGFEIKWAGGARIIANAAFRYFNGKRTLEIDPNTPAVRNVIAGIAPSEVSLARISPDGALNISFTRDGAAGRKLVIGTNAWKVYFPNGSSAVCLAVGGIELLSPQS